MQFDRYNLKANPFGMVPPLSKDLVWAGFPELKADFERIITRSLRLPSSTIVLNWGDYGSGKTHAARYFSKQDVLQKLCMSPVNKEIPLALILTFPLGKNPVKELFTQILDKLNLSNILSKIKEKFNGSENVLTEAIDQVTDNEFIKKVLNAFINLEDDKVDSFKNYLYGEKKDRTNLRLPRMLESDNDYVDFLSAFLSMVTYLGKAYSCVILWLDEFENITMQSITNINAVNNFIKGVMDKAPKSLLIFINFTKSSFANVTDLSAYLQPAMVMRLKEKIEFALPDSRQLKAYLTDLINNPVFRSHPETNKYMPFTEDMVDELITDIGNNISIRRFNESLSLMLESGYAEGKESIDKPYYESKKSEFGWKDDLIHA